MARILFFTILAMCLVCLIQASPVPGQGDQQPNLVDDVVKGLNAAGETVKKAWEDVANNPAVKQALTDVNETVQRGLKTAAEEIGKFAPKTE